MNDESPDLFEAVVEFPNERAKEALRRLVGLDAFKARLVKEAQVLLNPRRLEEWSKRHHGGRIALLQSFADRSPLFIFAGDVGTGKTALAESIGDVIARAEKLPITLFRLSLNVRGTGAVGQMTRMITSAFSQVRERGRKARGTGGKPSAGLMLLVDEADALAQSRASGQMHHEDRAGVNALVRGVDSLADGDVPAIVILCTNRLDAIDPAVRRRAADVFEFQRPDDSQRFELLKTALEDVGFTTEGIKALVAATGPNGSSEGFTFSDLRQRLLSEILMDAFPDRPVTFHRALEIAKSMKPTPSFGEAGARETSGSR